MKKFLALSGRAALVVATAMLLACTNSPTAPNGSARLEVRLTDTPFEDAKAVLVTFTEVSAHHAETGWTTLRFADGAASRTCDLKKLETAQDVLGTGALAPGHYTQLRLMVSRAAIHFDAPAAGAPCAPSIAAPAGRNANLEIPSGEIKLNRQFTLTEDGVTTILLDFDGDQSIHATGNDRYIMRPVIVILSVS